MTPAFLQVVAWGTKSKKGVLSPLNCTTRARARKLCYKGSKPVRILVTMVEILPGVPLDAEL